MKLSVKTLQGKTFSVEIELTETVAKLKATIEEQQGSGFPAALQKLIYAGKVLKDETALSEWNIKENDFIVCMVTKPKTAKPAAAPAAAPASAPAAAPTQPRPAAVQASSVPAPGAPARAVSATPFSDSSAAAPSSGLVVGEELNATVRQLCDMGFPEDQVQAALRAAFNNPERAVEYLMNGIPANAGMAPPPTASTTRTTAEGSAGGNPLEALRSHPQFPALRQLVQANPAALPAVMRQIGAQSPELLQIINHNQDAFVQLLNEPDTSPAVHSTPGIPGGQEGGMPDPQQFIQLINSLPAEQQQQMAAQMGINTEQFQQMAQMMANLPPEAMQQMFSRIGGADGAGSSPGYHTVQLTEEEAAAVTRLTEMGFEHNDVVQAYLACDKNEAMAANFLMDSMAADFDSAGAPGGSGGDDSDDIYE